MDIREKAMSWWNSLSSSQKTRICDLNTEIIGSIRRWETLTGREIELIHEKDQNNALLTTNKKGR